MQTVPERLSVTHPLVASMYLKKGYGDSLHGREDVLVIKTNFDESEKEYENFDSYLMELLGDLNALREQAEKSVGHFDRIDIRT
jgi:hypothetical protein